VLSTKKAGNNKKWKYKGCMNFEGADVVMLIVSLIVVCLLIIYETYMVGALIVPDHFMTAAIDVYVALTSQQSLYTGDVDDVSLTWRLCSST